MTRFALFLSVLFLAAVVGAQSPQLQSFEEIGTYSAGSILDLTFSASSNSGGGSGNHGGNHGNHNNCGRPHHRS